MNKFYRFGLVVLLALLLVTVPVSAQENANTGPIYVVKAGDTLWTIARKLHISYDDLLAVNDLDSGSSLIPGVQLVIPGLEGYSGVVDTIQVAYGENLESISRRYSMLPQDLVRLNRLTNPLELYVGVSVVVLAEEEIGEMGGQRVTLAPDQSAIELAVISGLNPWTLINANGEGGSWDLIPGEVLFIPGTESDGPGGFPAAIQDVKYSPTQFIQGHTNVMRVEAPQGTEINGSLGDYPLHFFMQNGESYLALQGVHAKEQLGLKLLSVSGTLPDGTPFAHSQNVQILSGNYRFEPDVVGVPPQTVGIVVTEEETELLKEFTDVATDRKYWSGGFVDPVPPVLAEAFSAYYGGRRSYNGSGYYYYHTGLDFFSSLGGDIYAAAPGKVVFTDSLLLHGNTTLIDHGWGVYTLYAHQTEILVRVGQQVTAGQLIGRVGSTGRSNGPHLHLEVWVGGIQVNPLDWLENVYP